VSAVPATILIVDDEARSRKLLEAQLKPEGYLTLSVACGEEALAAALSRMPDLIMLDVVMPGMDGYEVARRLKANPATAKIPVIMVTARASNSARLTGLKAGAEEFLTKPIVRAELWLRVRNLLRMKEFGDHLQNQSLILEQEVEQRTKSLGESEARYRHLVEQSDDGIFLCDRAGVFTMANSRACELLGYSTDEICGRNASFTYPPDEQAAYESRVKSVIAGNALRFERIVIRKDGSTFPTEISLKRLDDGTIQVIMRDITERHAQQEKIARLSRIHAVLSGINSAIVRIRDRRELFRQACRIIVEQGGFALGWISVLDKATGRLVAADQAGLPEGSGAGSAIFNGSIGLVPSRIAAAALHDRRAIAENLMEDSSEATASGRGRETTRIRRAAIDLGAKSVIVLPLIVDNATFGTLTLYALEDDFFDDEEVKLLEELAGDISFSLEFIAKGEQADYLAYYDVLTGLANRSLFLERLSQYMRSAADRGHELAVMLIDIERFKNINDSLGQQAGDELLRQVGAWLTRTTDDANVLARVDADHFALVLPEVRQGGNLAHLIEKWMASLLVQPFHLDDAVFRIAAKIGIAVFHNDGSSAETLFRNAESALKKAKSAGDRYLFFTREMTETVAVRLTLENQLRHALDNDEFVLHYQPKVTLGSNTITGAEALIRWNDPRTGLVPPKRFIPVLEETGLIYEAGRWALRKALEDYLRWCDAGLAAMRVCVNVSPLQLHNRGFVAEIEQAISTDARAASGLELEITESLIMEDIKRSITSLQAIRAMGVSIAIDDFGTGFSSLSYLARLPVDTLKIDRSFVIDMTESPQGLALVSTIIGLAHSLKLTVVAEGVETEEQSRLLRVLGCDEMQGYLFSKPIPAKAFEARFLPRSTVAVVR
jgi:diguanylate cyclase (GGDEF)-like protein/PAS domain S-box-containing protein